MAQEFRKRYAHKTKRSTGQNSKEFYEQKNRELEELSQKYPPTGQGFPPDVRAKVEAILSKIKKSQRPIQDVAKAFEDSEDDSIGGASFQRLFPKTS